MMIKELSMEERPREKMLRGGADTLSNSELLAIILRTGAKDLSVLRLAEEILSKDEKGLLFLTDCTMEELSEIKGVGQTKACQILAAVELGKRLSARQSEVKFSADSPESVAKLFMQEMRYYKKEFFYVLLLNAKGEIIMVDKTAIGDISSAIIHPREVFRMAVKRGAAAVVLVHNHPSGNPFPSNDDIATTKRLVEAGEIMGIHVLDHVIIGDGSYISLKKRNLM